MVSSIFNTNNLQVIIWFQVVNYEVICSDVAQSCMNGAPNENQTYSWRLASLVE